MGVFVQPLPKKDWVILGMQAFFFLMAVTVELYWVIYSRELVARSRTDLLARLFSYYGRADSAYFDTVTPFTHGLETIQVFVTQPLNLWLIYAIVKRRPYRHALQLTIASYLTYSVILYFWTAHLSGYASMRDHDPQTILLFALPNMPWLLGHIYMAYDSIRAINRSFRLQNA
jgi:hypothetical protein